MTRIDDETMKKIDMLMAQLNKPEPAAPKSIEKFEDMKTRIVNETVEFNRMVKMGLLTQKQRDEYINRILPDMEQLLIRPECGWKDKILMKSAIKMLERTKALPVK